ncbi:phosphomethylpyrimidine synthase [Clostridia bacterium]|nr:phosphomethylpyrimidine synthase [Clostridia bacterium]
MVIAQNNIKKTEEVLNGYAEVSYIEELFSKNVGVSYIHHKNNPVLIGSDFLLKVNTSIGISDPIFLDEEIRKIEAIRQCSTVSEYYHPDLVMDHTNVILKKPIWRYLVEILDCPIGTVPVYSIGNEKSGIDKIKLLELVEEMAVCGVNFMTFHPTATLELATLAKNTRKISSTSWGGSLVLEDLRINNRERNVVADCYSEILAILKKYNVTISIGSVFRPARISQALDDVHKKETNEQREYIEWAKRDGVNVIMEGMGHATGKDIIRYCELIKDHNVPIMPLGPMIFDSAIIEDNEVAAMGAYLMAYFGNLGIVNSVTRVEHLGGVPTIDNVKEGLRSAVIVAHGVNIDRFPACCKIDNEVSDMREEKVSCVVEGGLFGVKIKDIGNSGCSRCNKQCPLKKNRRI